MMPTIEEIAVKTIVSIEIERPLKEAIQKMASSNHRNIVVIENLSNNHKIFYLLTISDLIEYKLCNIDENVLLKELESKIKHQKYLNIQYDVNPNDIVETLIAIAYEGKFAGYLTIADSIKEDAAETVQKLQSLGVKVTMLSGDKATVVKAVAGKLGIPNAFGDLLPEDKVNKVKEIKARNETVAFVGDGVNDAPVVALSDIGIAMGGLGSDAIIETADVVIQDDKPSKIPMAINIGKQTKKIVWQNIALAFGVKAVVLVLGAGGLATMWEAVFADVGVALLAILNAVRIQKMKF